MEIIKENFRKTETIHGIYLDYVDCDEEGNREIFYKESKVKTILYMENSIIDKLDDIDGDLYYDCELRGILKTYYKNGDIHEKNITRYAHHNGRESYYYKQDVEDINQNIYECEICNNSKMLDDNTVTCNLEKIELYWTDIEIEINEYECEFCLDKIELKSDELNSCVECGCNCCPDCLIKNDYVAGGYVCPKCHEEYMNEEYME